MKLSNTRIKQYIKKAVEDNTPDMMDQILLRLEREEGADIMNSYEAVYPANRVPELTQPKKARNKVALWAKRAATIAAMLVLVFGGYFAYSGYVPESTIRFDVNPAIELKVNRYEKVLSAIPLNEDAKVILDNMNLKNTDLNIAVNALIGSMVKNGYVSEIKNSILISVDSNNKEKGIRLQEQLLNEVDDLLAVYSVEGAVLSQTIEDDSRLAGLAHEFDISLGKAALIDLLVNQDKTLEFSNLAPLSVNDINLLIASRQLELVGIEKRGQANSAAYIGEDAAKKAVLAHSKIPESKAIFTEIKLDYEHGEMIYEIEFISDDGEYDYEIDAVTGEILKFEHEMKKGATHNQGAQNEKDDKDKDKGSQTNKATHISEAEAKRIALGHAKVSEKAAEFKKIKKDREDGRVVYEIKFLSGDMEYEYEIDAVTGAVVKVEREKKRSAPVAPSSGTEKTTNKNNDSVSSDPKEYIGINKAESIALKNAGLSRDAVRKLEVELEKEKGRMIYEVEFVYDGYEYEYEIDAFTGKILSKDIDRD